MDAFNAEMETVGEAFEEMSGRNTELLQQLAQRDERSSALLAERIQAQHTATSASEQRDRAEAAQRLAEQQAVALQERVTGLEQRLQVGAVLRPACR